MLPLQAFGIDSISLSYRLQKRRDRFGNYFRFLGEFSGHKVRTGAFFRRNMYDVFLVFDSPTAGTRQQADWLALHDSSFKVFRQTEFVRRNASTPLNCGAPPGAN